MSLDERVDALTHSVELLASMHYDNEKRLAESLLKMEAQHAEMRAEHLSNERLMTAIHADMRDILLRLSVIAEAHDEKLDEHGQRISRLEQRPQ